MERSTYELQHFGFTAFEISLEREHALNKFVGIALKAITDKLKLSPATVEVLKKEKDTIHAGIMTAFDDDLKGLAELDKRVFTIPKHVLLPQDFEQSKQYSEEDELNLDRELAWMKQHFKENAVMIATLNMEKERYELVQSHMENEKEILLALLCARDSIDMPKLRSLVSTTKAIMNEKELE